MGFFFFFILSLNNLILLEILEKGAFGAMSLIEVGRLGEGCIWRNEYLKKNCTSIKSIIRVNFNSPSIIK